MPPPPQFRPLSKYQKEDIMEVIKAASIATTLTAWEVTFLSSIGQMLTTFEEATRLTKKQLATVYLIKERRLQKNNEKIVKKSLDPEGDAMLNSLRTLENRRFKRDNE